MDKQSRIKLGTDLLAIFVGALMLELFVFNFRHWISLSDTEVEIPLEYCVYQGEAEQMEDGSVRLFCGEEESLVIIPLTSADTEINSIGIRVYCEDSAETWWNYMREPYAVIDSPMVRSDVILNLDDGITTLTGRLLYGRKEQRDVLCLPEGSRPSAIGLRLSGVKGNELRLSGLWLNAELPMRFLPLRLLAVFAFFAFVYALMPQSRLWSDSLFDKEGSVKKKYRITALLSFLAIMGLSILLLRQNQVYMQDEGAFHPYTDLARALAGAHLYLDEAPSEELLALEDPYDPIAKLEDVPFHLDYAFYNGKYYIYFGIVPCLLLYLPWYLITGRDLPGQLAMPLMYALVYLGLWLMIRELLRRYRPGASAALALLLWLGGVSALSLPQAMGDASNYYAPMLPAVSFFFFGMSACLAAARWLEMERRKGGLVLTALGSLCCALITGCRPQMVLGAACTLPVLLPKIFPKKEKGRGMDVPLLLAFVLPYIPVAATLMVYNALRFGSPFDFGAMKNLTFAFLTDIGFYPIVLLAGIYYYLFRPFRLTGEYPYLQRYEMAWSNPNLLASHPSVGGLFLLYPLLLSALFAFLPVRKGKRHLKETAWLGRVSFLLVLVMAMLTAQMGGLMDRYRLDMAPYAALAFVCGVLVLLWKFDEGGVSKKQRFILRSAFLFLVLLAVIVSGLSYGMEGLFHLYMVNPESYAAISGAIAFWR